ncbi:MAG: Ig-like domain-containing protein, partial [Sulfurovaceae bacterium]
VVAIYRDGTYLGNATLNGNSWSYTDSGLVNGNDYTYTARVEDAAGNQGATSNAFDIGIDTTPPVTNSIDITYITEDTGISDTDFITYDQTLVIGGTLANALQSDESVQVSLDGGTTWVDATVSGTTWSYDNTGTTLAEGDYDTQVRIVDAAGNVGATDAQTVTVDTTPPATNSIDITYITEDTGTPGDFITYDQTLVIGGTLANALGANELVQVSLDGGTTWVDATVTGTTWSYDNTGSALSLGEYDVEARIIDVAGNLGADDAQKVTVINQNHAPTDLVTSVNDIDEYAKAGTIAATMYVIDPDLPNDSHTYALSGADADKFVIDDNGTITVKNDGSLYLGCEANGEDQIVTVTVTVTDAGGLSYSENVAINITNVMEAPVKYCNPCSHQDLNIIGGDNNDIIVTGFGNDFVMACAGDDCIKTGCGDDTIYAGAGNDKIYAGWGDDTIYGGSGDDKIYADGGDDMIYGDLGADWIDGGCGNDTISYENSQEAVNASLNCCFTGKGGDAEGDRLFGVDVLIGSNFDDTLSYNPCWANTIDGGLGNDTIYGGAGDTIIGGMGDDTLIVDSHCIKSVQGGEGDDTLILGSTTCLDTTGWGAPEITSIENIDMTDGDWWGDKLYLDKNSVDSMTDNDILYVQGDNHDTVVLESQGWWWDPTDWTQGAQETVDGITYNVYMQGDQTVMIDQDVSVTYQNIL